LITGLLIQKLGWQVMYIITNNKKNMHVLYGDDAITIYAIGFAG